LLNRVNDYSLCKGKHASEHLQGSARVPSQELLECDPSTFTFQFGLNIGLGDLKQSKLDTFDGDEELLLSNCSFTASYFHFCSF
jgi:hypothetical protein